MKCPACGELKNETGEFCTMCGAEFPKDTVILESGALIGNRYKIISHIDSGGMGNIYKVHDVHLDKEFVLKEMSEKLCIPENTEIKLAAWFEREAKILCSLRHPNIPAIIDFFKDEDKVYIVMEYIDGKSIADESLPLESKKVINFAKSALDILDYLHKKNIIHRDIKTNHFITEKETGNIFLIDFGAAKTYLSGNKTAIGTNGFASPEHYEGNTDERSDIFSLGAVLYHLLTGIDPAGITPFKFEPIKRYIPDADPVLVSAIEKALKYDPESRFSSAQQMKNFLTGEDRKEHKISIPQEPKYEDYTVIKRSVPAESSVKFKEKTGDSGRVFYKFQDFGGWIARIAFVRPDNMLAVALYDGEIILRELSSGKKIGSLKKGVTASTLICTDMVISPDGALIAQSFDNRTIIIWDKESYRRLSSLNGHTRSITCLEFINNYTLVSGSEDGSIIIWDIRKGEPIYQYKNLDSAVKAVSASSSPLLLIAGTRKGTVYMWDMNRISIPEYTPVTSLGHEDGVSAFDIRRSDSLAISAGADGFVKRWEISAGQPPVLKASLSQKAHNGDVKSVSISPAKRQFITGGEDTEVKLWDADEMRSFITLTNLNEPVLCTAFSSDGKLAAAASEQGKLIIWEV